MSSQHAPLIVAFVGIIVEFIGCGGSYTLGELGEQPVLSGQIDAWNHGADFILRVGVPESNAVLGWAPIDASGNFTVTLPGSAALAPYLFRIHTNLEQPFTQPACSGSLSTDPPEFGMTTLLLTAGLNGELYSLEQNGDVDGSHIEVNYNFLDQDMTQTGNAYCESTSGRLPRDIYINNHYKAGWNSAISVTVTNQNSQVITGNTGPVPAGLKWHSKLKNL